MCSIAMRLVTFLLLCTATAAAWGQASDWEQAEQLEGQLFQLDQQGKYAEAARVGEHLLAISEKMFGPTHPGTAAALNNLAAEYTSMGEYKKALPLHQRALTIREKTLEPDDPAIAASLNNLAHFSRKLGNYNS